MSKPTIKLILDKRREKNNGMYPVKLSVFYNDNNKKITKLYSIKNISNNLLKTKDENGKEIHINIDEYDEKTFNEIIKVEKSNNKHYFQSVIFKTIVESANKVANNIEIFNFIEFERNLFGKVKDLSNVFDFLDEIIEEKYKYGKISTAEKYKSTKVCLQKFLEFEEMNSERLEFKTITEKFLNEFEYYCLNNRIKTIKKTTIKKLPMSKATIGIYTRNIRAIFNTAIERKIIDVSLYPFGLKKYNIPTSEKVKKALTESQIKELWNTIPQNYNQEKAKDFWFFSYFTYGMNLKDICELKHSDINDELITYVRAKTKSTKKVETKKKVPLTDNIKNIIEKYKDNSSTYLFGIININYDAKQVNIKIRNFNEYVNKHFRKFALNTSIDKQLCENIGTYYARHSFATISIKKGASMELISEIMHDGNFATTKGYFSGFDDEVLQELSNDLSLL